MSSSTYPVSQAQAKLPSLLKEEESFAISVHGEIKGFYLSKQRLEAMLESVELMGRPAFRAALRKYKSGKMKFHSVAELDAEMSA
jgi:hypothetical protein